MWQPQIHHWSSFLLTCLSGEHHYLFGSYFKSDNAWQSQIWNENLKCKNDCFDSLCLLFMFRSSHHHSCLSAGCDRGVFKETQLCLALLYSLLSQYRLREAQEFGDHMARLLLHRAGQQRSILTCESAFKLLDSLLMLQTRGISTNISFTWLLSCSRLVSLPVGASGSSQWRSLFCGPEPREIYGLLFHQPTSVHPSPSSRGPPASSTSSSWCVFSVVCVCETFCHLYSVFGDVLFQLPVLGAWCRWARRRSREQWDSSSCQRSGQQVTARTCSCSEVFSLSLCGWLTILGTGKPLSLWA